MSQNIIGTMLGDTKQKVWGLAKEGHQEMVFSHAFGWV